ncbi:MAG TPA: sigma-70 family RNA polymerase sigma factor [Terracidiphilus sp.]|nr:sigma-70 family RNA polymerase sigma factor [Terracidiphilus sp.]
MPGAGKYTWRLNSEIVNDPTQRENIGASSDEQLMSEFARGSADAFTALFCRYRTPICGFFRRRLAEPSQAEELAQEVFLALLRSAGRYEITASFRTYLYAIALRILRAHRRKTIFRAMFQGAAPPGYEPSERSGTESALMLREAVGKLDGIDREMVMLREYEELTYQEIAEVLQIPVNTVRSRLFRARRSLQELLALPVRGSAGTQLASAEEHP